MSKKHKKQHRHHQPQPPPKAAPTPESRRQAGLNAFNAGRYAEAAGAWEKLDLAQPPVAAAVAEAHFRQAMVEGANAQQVTRLQRASQLAPADPRYAYHLGLAYHREGQLDAALEAYRRALAHGLSRPGAGVVVALAMLQQDPRADPASVPGLSETERRTVDLLARLLRSRSRTAEKSDALRELGRLAGGPAEAVLAGLAALVDGDAAAAYRALSGQEARALPHRVDALRRYYAGVAALRAGDVHAARTEWEQAARPETRTPRLSQNLAALHLEEVALFAEQEDWSAVTRAATAGLKALPGDAALGAFAVAALDRLAHTAAAAGDWTTAARHWEQARDILGAVGGIGSPRPIAHNLALAYEALGQWYPAAEAWRAMLRSRPRKKTVEGFGDAHWTWVRRRTVECYRQAGRPDEAIAIFRQALKADPADVEMHFGLAEALAAAGQEQSAANELARLVAQHPEHVQARVRLSELYQANGQWEVAEEELLAALRIEPESRDLRSRVGLFYKQDGTTYHEEGNLQAARESLHKALEYVPDDYSVHLALSRVELDAHHKKAAREHVERGLSLGEGKTDAYAEAFLFWLVDNNLDEARAVLARAEAGGHLSAELLATAGVMSLQQSEPEVEDFGLFDFLRGAAPAPRRKPRPGADRQRVLGRELIERAAAGGSPRVEAFVLGALGFKFPDVSLPYARRALERTPEEPNAWMMLGMLLGAGEQDQEAREALRRAARLARDQGNTELARAANEARSAIGTPAFRFLLQSLAQVRELGEEFDEDWDPNVFF